MIRFDGDDRMRRSDDEATIRDATNVENAEEDVVFSLVKSELFWTLLLLYLYMLFCFIHDDVRSRRLRSVH